MDNKSFEEPSSSSSSGSDTSRTISNDDRSTLPISEEERLRQQLEAYKELIKNMEQLGQSRVLDAAGGGDNSALYPSSSRSPLNVGASTSSLANTLSESPTIDLRSQRKRFLRKDLPPDFAKEVVLLNSFRVGRKRHHVYLNEGRLTWEREHRGDSLKDLAIPDSKAAPSFHRQIVPVEDILAVRLLGKPKRHEGEPSTSGGGVGEEELQGTTFQLHYARRRTRNPNMWKSAVIKFHNPDARITGKWATTLQDILCSLEHRPRHILMFVNPYGGKRVAMEIYNKVAKPLFQLADVDVSLVVTQRQNQVTDIIMNNYLEQYDGIVCCGGDGTFNELYNGLVRREILQTGMGDKALQDLELPRPHIPIGVIPGGSTNTISYCMNGTDDVKTAVLNVVLGKVDGMDLSSVHRNVAGNRELLRLYASVMSYGFLGDVTKEAEHYRSLGPKRYDYVGVKKFLKNTGYEAELRILVDGHEKQAAVTEGGKCLEDCGRCSEAVASGVRGLGEELRALDEEEQGAGERWKVVKGRFFMVSGANISCACERSPNGLSPNCHLGDGCIDLILVNHSTFLNNLRLASRLSASGQHIATLPFIETYRTRAFAFSVPGRGRRDAAGDGQGPTTEEPSINASTVPITAAGGAQRSSTKKSSWNCDGEVIEDTELIVRSHCQLVRVFRSGIQSKDERKDCCGFC